jgi:hypothetical protein
MVFFFHAACVCACEVQNDVVVVLLLLLSEAKACRLVCVMCLWERKALVYPFGMSLGCDDTAKTQGWMEPRGYGAVFAQLLPTK